MLRLKLIKHTGYLIAMVAMTISIVAHSASYNPPINGAMKSALLAELTEEEIKWLANHKVISVGVKHSWKPIEFVSEKKRFRGITMDYLNILEPILGVRFKKLDIDDMPSENVDILSSVSNPKSLDNTKYLLTNPILTFRHAIYVHKDTHDIREMQDLYGKKVAVFRYGQLLEFLTSDFPTVNLLKIDMIEEAFNDMDIQHANAYIGNEMVVDYEANLQGISFLNKVGYAPIQTELTMAVRKDWPILQSILNKSFSILESEKNIILNNWDMSLFKKKDIFVSIVFSLFAFFVSFVLIKVYKLKQVMKKQEQEAQQLILHQAHYDIQTDLPNRIMFNIMLAEEIKLSQKRVLPISLLYIDLDTFKIVNDLHGHSVGDKLITQVARRIEECIRPADKIARLGGDEFIVILTNIDDLNIIKNIAENILQSLSAPFEINQFLITTSSSIGSAIFPNDTKNMESLIKNADMAMYEAKKQGGNCYKAFTQSMKDLVKYKQSISNDLKSAIAKQEFRLHYQPIIDLKTNKTLKAEALIRWQHPEKGLIGPFEFIEIAEEANIISEIGDWVFKQVLKDSLKLQEAVGTSFSVSLNVSPKQLGTGSLLTEWPKLIKKYGLPPSSIGIEITEGLLVEPNTETKNILTNLRESGAHILIDDFGTGYSSLSYLKKLDVDFIKIDKSFVQTLSGMSEDMVFCETIIVMAHKLGLKVIAEGIETVDQKELLFEMGCDYGQGYLFSKPIPLDQLVLKIQSPLKNIDATVKQSKLA